MTEEASRRRKKRVSDTTEDLLAQTYHIDGRVTAIEGRMNTFGEQLNRIESSLLNKQSPWGVSAVMSLVVLVGGTLYGISGYVDLQVKNQATTIDRNTEITDYLTTRVNELETFRSEMHYEVGRMQQAQDRNDVSHDDFKDSMSGIDNRVRRVEEQAAAAEVARKDIADFVEDVDVYGSRRWMNEHRGQQE